MKNVYLATARRSAVGSFGGSLSGLAPTELGATIAKATIEAIDLDPAAIGYSIFGQVMPTDAKDAYLSRVIALNAGLPVSVPAVTVNRLCGSGMQSVIQAVQQVQLGEAEIVLAGGAEVMSRVPHQTQDIRWGTRMGNPQMVDMLLEGLKDPFHSYAMGVTAENVAEEYDVDRDTQDAYALQSHQRASTAIREGRFADQIIPVEVTQRRKTITFAEDEHVRHDAQLDDFAKLRTVFKKDGTVTAGNASGINDGAAALVVVSEQGLKDHNLTPLARFVSGGHAGVDPSVMGIGPVPASRQALERASLGVHDLSVIESNEAFAAQACAVANELGFDPAKVNPNGSGISLGHPVGATGAIIVTKLVHEMQRISGQYGLATMCIGGGQGVASVWERC
ncbi:beta-ketothiolase BktB [Thalassovita mediterranea]|uniref:Beta-ketothiolase BktB n=1 Tax=Thalassovita mediterranea TaxID=340021 RepID=A0A0P1H5K8_9RHOB|nr:beta-ketothiolase BktB [Thalassovita mediterranea]CUH84783.1 Beta-ketothiolase BktB [Thalassovita mediterranea]SIS35551.1 acetyl-CoA C-acetyltransferase [Thalassovita mediterranea]